eukprot:5366963-Pyramimonas_sp.AAC.1
MRAVENARESAGTSMPVASPKMRPIPSGSSGKGWGGSSRTAPVSSRTNLTPALFRLAFRFPLGVPFSSLAGLW